MVQAMDPQHLLVHFASCPVISIHDDHNGICLQGRQGRLSNSPGKRDAQERRDSHSCLDPLFDHCKFDPTPMFIGSVPRSSQLGIVARKWPGHHVGLHRGCSGAFLSLGTVLGRRAMRLYAAKSQSHPAQVTSIAADQLLLESWPGILPEE